MELGLSQVRDGIHGSVPGQKRTWTHRPFGKLFLERYTEGVQVCQGRSYVGGFGGMLPLKIS